MADKVTRIGFIGLGRMGQPMSQRLLQAGYQVKAFDLRPERVAALAASGAEAAISVADAATGVDLVISIVYDDASVIAVALGPQGVLAHAAPGTIFAEMSTVSPATSVRVAEAADQAGVPYLRFKPNGSTVQAESGTLALYASGPREAFDRCVDVFRVMGKPPRHVGTGEQAIYVKLVHSTMIGIQAAMIGEALTLGERAGADWEQMLEVINESAAGSLLFNYKIPLLRSRDYTKPQSTVDVVGKDTDMILAAAKSLGVPMPMTALMRELFRIMQVKGAGGLDFISIVTQFEEMAGVKPAGERRPS